MSRKEFIFAALFLGSGAALLVYILSGISFLFTFLAIFFGVIVISLLIWRYATLEKRETLKMLIKVGLIAGLLATLAYDLSRYLLVTLTPMTIWPFEAFMIFGQAFVGEGIRSPEVFMLGLMYHLLNGLTFAVAYTLAFGKKGMWAGLVWAMLLEVLMLTVYPGWLNIEKIGQFVGMSFFGHVFYGLVLGYVAKRLILRKAGDHNGRNN